MKNTKREIIIALVMIVAMVMIVAARPLIAWRQRDVANGIKDSTVSMFENDRWAGSGVIIAKYNGLFDATYILTVNHLGITDDFVVRINTEHNGTIGHSADFKFDILLAPDEDVHLEPTYEGDLSKDLVLIVVSADIGKAAYLSNVFEYEQEVMTCAYADGYIPVLNNGLITLNLEDKFRHSARISMGHSGGGVFNSKGHLIGINEFVLSDVVQGYMGMPTPNINRERAVAVSSKAILLWLEEGGYSWVLQRM